MNLEAMVSLLPSLKLLICILGIRSGCLGLCMSGIDYVCEIHIEIGLDDLRLRSHS